MKNLFAGLFFGFFALTFSCRVLAADRGTAEEAVALVKKAIAYIKVNGKEKAFAEFNNPSGAFKDRDLYIVVTDLNGKVLANGVNPKIVGKNVLEIRDVDGKLIYKTTIELANSKGNGWIDYKWVSPVTSVIEQKSSYIEKLDDIIVACGIYK